MSMWYEEAKKNLEDLSFSNWEYFLISLINEYNKHDNKSLVQDIVIRSLERREDIENDFILDHLLGELGLFPYVEHNNTTKDLFRTSIFTTPHDENKIFHIRQAEVFHRLMNGENIILSAPTSFGKSLIIEAIVSSYEFNNIVIVVPTIALIDELKKKLYKYKKHYNIVSQVNQKTDKKNIFILTQERVLESKNILFVDFFIIDEFYKLAPSLLNDERCDRLNLAFKSLYSKCNRFYMLGPRINGLVEGIEDELRCTFLKFDSYVTVATNEYYYDIPTKGKDSEIDIERDKILFPLLNSIGRNEQTVIYCKSPRRASLLMRRLLDSGLLSSDNINDELAIWLSNSFHKEWSLVQGVKHGIAYHHAQLPRAVGALFVDLFNESKINILICTSTLIEGVNTNAKNIIIYDDCIGRKKLDMFTFNNISGRSGRMFKHFIGNVYIFGKKPSIELPFIDIPIVTQSDNASDSLLLHMGNDINDNNKERVKKFYEQDVLPLSILLRHQGVNPDLLIELANDIIFNLKSWNEVMCWEGIYPKNNQLKHLSELLYKHFNINMMANGTVRSAKQLNKKLIDIIRKVDDKELIIQDYEYGLSQDPNYSIDDSIQAIFNFKKNLVNYNLPKLIFAINDVQEYVFKNYNYSSGDYKTFATHLENFYFPSTINTLEEFGIPNQISKKIFEKNIIDQPDNIDFVLSFLSTAKSRSHEYLDEFELDFLKRALAYI